MRGLFTPLLPDDYLELINPLWSTRELRGRIERIKRENDNAVTILIRPGFEWEGHKPGQYLRVGVVVDGVHHWRAYSLTSDPDRPDGWISITPKTVDEGIVSPFFNQNARPGRHRPPRRGRGHVRPSRSAAREASLHLGGIWHHSDHEHAAAHSRGRRDSRRSPHPLRPARRRRDLRRHAGEDRLRERGLQAPSPDDRRRRADRPEGPRRPVPGLARARDVPLGSRRDDRCLRRLFRVGLRRRPREAPPRALPAEGRRRPRKARAARSPSSSRIARRSATAASRSSRPGRKRASSSSTAAAWASATPASES